MRRAIVLLCVVGLLAVGGGTYRAVQDARRADACAPLHALATIELPSAGRVGSAYSAGTVSSAASAEDQLLTPVPSRPLKVRISPAELARIAALTRLSDTYPLQTRIVGGRLPVLAKACSSDRR